MFLVYTHTYNHTHNHTHTYIHLCASVFIHVYNKSHGASTQRSWCTCKYTHTFDLFPRKEDPKSSICITVLSQNRHTSILRSKMCTVNRKTRFLCTKKKYEDRYRKANAVRGKEEEGGVSLIRGRKNFFTHGGSRINWGDLTKRILKFVSCVCMYIYVVCVCTSMDVCVCVSMYMYRCVCMRESTYLDDRTSIEVVGRNSSWDVCHMCVCVCAHISIRWI